LVVLPFIFPKVFLEKNWNIGKQILWLLWIVTSIALGNVFYSVSTEIIHWTGFADIIRFQGFTISVAILPIIGITLISQNLYLKKNVAKSAEVNSKIKPQAISNENSPILTIGSEEFELQSILYIESEGNYAHVFHVQNNKPTSTLVRSTLKNIELESQDYTELFRCHRAYIVNLNSILHVNGNAQGYKLSIKNTHFKVPVSRSFLEKFHDVFN